MQIQKVSRRFDVHPNGLMLFLALVSAIVGAAAGYSLRAMAASAPGAVESHPVAVVSNPSARINAAPAVETNPLADVNELRQEQRDIRQAQRENAVALPATVTVTDKSAAPLQIDLCMIHAITRCSLLPATVTLTDKSAAPVQIDLWQDHLDLLQMQRSLQSAKDVPSVTAPATITAAERYQALKARQIEKLENLP